MPAQFSVPTSGLHVFSLQRETLASHGKDKDEEIDQHIKSV